MANYNREKRKYVIGAVATGIVLIYIVRLFTLQIMSDDYKKNADSNAFLKKIQIPVAGSHHRSQREVVGIQPAIV